MGEGAQPTGPGTPPGSAFVGPNTSLLAGKRCRNEEASSEARFCTAPVTANQINTIVQGLKSGSERLPSDQKARKENISGTNTTDGNQIRFEGEWVAGCREIQPTTFKHRKEQLTFATNLVDCLKNNSSGVNLNARILQLNNSEKLSIFSLH